MIPFSGSANAVTKISRAELGSMNMPAMRKQTLTTRRNVIAPASIAVKNSLIWVGTCANGYVDS